MKRLAILGAGTFAVEVLEAAESAPGIDIVAFVVSEPGLVRQPTLEGRPVVPIAELPWPVGDVEMIAGIVTTKRRLFIEDVARRGFAFTSAIHPAATVSRRAEIERGTFAGAGVIVGANARIGAHTVLNRGANVAHDVRIGAFSTIGPGAIIAGGVSIGEGVYVGVGAVIRDHVEIADGAVIAAGAVVVKSVKARVLVAGCPATVVREGVDPF